eukprot:TRINITY_DN1175_c0_g1_i3.p1 TRINITY_DN1175_c0_g1~~TRINITY_DN1175_c0_g1_i3.p1  ORF type:complete len:276 (+),score=37.50 TRINITY_DN1175_c0_g1_i3:145-972(+)
MLAPGGPQGPSAYEFGATYAAQGLFLRGQVSHTGDVATTGRVELSRRLAAMIRGQASAPGHSLTLEPEYKGTNFVASGFLRRQAQLLPPGQQHDDKYLKIWQYCMGYNQGFNFSPNFSIGAMVQGVIGYPGALHSSFETGCRYQHLVPKTAGQAGNDFVVCGSVTSDMSLTASYAHKVSESDKSTIWLSTDLRLRPLAIEAHLRGEDTVGAASVGYQIILRQSSLKGMLDSTGKVSASVEEKVNAAVTVLMSAELDHPKEDYKFGFGVNLGGGMQ